MTMVFLIGEFLQEAKLFVEDGVHPQFIIFVFYTLSNMCKTQMVQTDTKNVIGLSPLT
jgi:hypothetical protein